MNRKMSIVVGRLFSMVMGQMFLDGFTFWIVSSWKDSGCEIEMVVVVEIAGGGVLLRRWFDPILGCC